jgi:hypothetical protein
MPIVFAQPAPADSFRRISQQGNLPAYLSAYASMAGDAQASYDRQGETAARERLGYANLHADTALRQQALGIQQTELEMRPAMQAAAIQQRAQLELDMWTQQQNFNARDAEELTRQQNSLSELMTKVQSGEISEQEYYQMASSAAPRVNALTAKMQSTKQREMEQDIQRSKMLNDLTQQTISRNEAFHAAQTQNAFGWEVDQGSMADLAQSVIQENPALAADPAALARAVEQKSRAEGKGHRWYQTRNGREIHPEDAARIERQQKDRELRAQKDVKDREVRAKAVGDYIAHRMKPDSLTGATPDIAAVAKEAEAYADQLHRLSMPPEERKEYDARQELQQKRLEEAKKQAATFEGELKNLTEKGNFVAATPGYARDLAYLVEFHKRFPGGPAFAPKKEQGEYNAAYARAMEAKRAGAGELTREEQVRRTIGAVPKVFGSLTNSVPQPSASSGFGPLPPGTPLGR